MVISQLQVRRQSFDSLGQSSVASLYQLLSTLFKNELTQTQINRKMSQRNDDNTTPSDNSSYNASQDLFSDEPMEIDDMPTDIPTTVKSSPAKTPISQPISPEKKKPVNVAPPPGDLKSHWRGFPLSDFNTNLRLKPIHPKASHNSEDRHIVCVDFGKYKEGSVPVPHPQAHNGFPRDIWDGHHVRMPFSQENLFPVTSSNGKKDLQKR